MVNTQKMNNCFEIHLEGNKKLKEIRNLILGFCSTNSKSKWLSEFPTIKKQFKNNFDHLESKKFVWQRGLFTFLTRMLPDVVFLFQWSMSVNHQEFLHKIWKINNSGEFYKSIKKIKFKVLHWIILRCKCFKRNERWNLNKEKWLVKKWLFL